MGREAPPPIGVIARWATRRVLARCAEDATWRGFRADGPYRADLKIRPAPRRLCTAVRWVWLIALLSPLALAPPATAQTDWQTDWPDGEGLIDQAPHLAQQVDPTLSSPQRRIRVFPRSSVRWQARWFPSEDGRERIAVIDSGVNILIDHVAGFDTVDISTDRIVIWTSADQSADILRDTAQSDDRPLEFYMEGNIIFRQQDRVIYAERMYYNVREQYGVVLDGELLTPIPGYQGIVRLKAEVLKQVDPFRIEGYSGAITTSRLGVPRYWLQSGNFTYENIVSPTVTPGDVEPGSGLFQTGTTKRVVSRDNRIYLAEWPIFIWPVFSANLDRPSFYLESFSINNDRVFGTQVLTDWNLYQLLGWRNAPSGTQWTGSLDYLSDRGWGLGSNFQYDRNGFLSHPGRAVGFLDAWGLQDKGRDNLGLQRRSVAPEADPRYRILGRHRQYLNDGYQLTGELGWVSDRNFLEQYYEQEWDEEKDQRTGVELKKRDENHSWSVTGDARINEFFTQTTWAPRADHFWIAEPILSDWFSWTEHSNVGYAKLGVATTPEDPRSASAWQLLPWEVPSEGVRAISRQRLDLPLQWGGAKIVPYVMGEAGYWQQDLSGGEVTRLLGQTGLRASIPFVRVDPNIHSTLFNLNGIAHKIVLEGEYLWAEADADLTDFPLYDPVDDDAVEFARVQFYGAEFGGIGGTGVPNRFDERFYAARSGLQRWVTAPSSEIAEDLSFLRLAARQRWQTKRGMPGRQRVVDWVTLDVEGFLYPNPDRDNFGQEVGLLNYDFRWHLGDRVTLLSDGMADFFADGLRTISLSAMFGRPGRIRTVAGLRSIEGPISSSILYSSSSYRLSPKWILNYGSSYDFSSTGNIVQRGQVVRVGESFLVGLGWNYDRSRDNFGVRFSIEPRFLSGRLSRVGGVPIPPVGFEGLE